jgi:hypothetical protein
VAPQRGRRYGCSQIAPLSLGVRGMNLWEESRYALLLVVIIPAVALAGPNAGGVLLVHYRPGIEVPGEAAFVEGGLAACDSAIVEAPPDSTVMWFVCAAFPPGASPVLKGVSFGCEFNADSVAILWSATRPGATEIKYEESASWPYTGSGTSVVFEDILTSLVNEVYCFSG